MNIIIFLCIECTGCDSFSDEKTFPVLFGVTQKSLCNQLARVECTYTRIACFENDLWRDPRVGNGVKAGFVGH